MNPPTKVLASIQQYNRNKSRDWCYTVKNFSFLYLRRPGMKTIKRFPRISRFATAPTSLLLIIFILAIAFPQPALAANPAVTCTDTHIVIRGEWLVKIAGQYGVPWYEIALANNIKSPYTI